MLPWRKAGLLKSSRRLSGFGPAGCQERPLYLLAGVLLLLSRGRGDLGRVLSGRQADRQLGGRFGQDLGRRGLTIGTVLNLKQLPRRTVKRFREGLVSKAHRLVYHSTLGLRVTKRRERDMGRRGLSPGPLLSNQGTT